MTVDIREFLERRLSEDELWAKAASADRAGKATVPAGVHWTWAAGDHWDPVEADPLEPYMGGHDGRWSQPVVLRSVEEWHLGYGPPTNTLPLKVCEAEELRTADGAHIVRHDPARVLRDVEAARRRIELAAKLLAERGHPFWAYAGEQLLKIEAVPYADHPDYDPSWSPESVTPDS